MEVHPYYGPGNIVVDSCVDCGFIWLDHGELTRVEQASSGRSTSTYTTCGTTSPLSERAMNAPPVNYGESKDESPLCALADLIFFGGR
jgi:Zn-finger nucleic acid-binding protein